MLKPPAVLIILVLVLPVGCRNSMRHQQAISMLRAENLQLEDEYYAMKSQYEYTLAQLRRATANAPTMAPGVGPGSTPTPALQEPEILIEGGFEDFSPNPDGGLAGPPNWIGSPRTLNPPGWVDPNDRMQVASHIADVLVQAESSQADGVSVSLQPVDKIGDVIPLAGDLEIEVASAKSPLNIIDRWDLSRNQVQGSVSDQPGASLGIHMRLPWTRSAPNEDSLVAHVHYRTADNRRISRTVPLRANDGVSVALGDRNDSPLPRWSPRR